MFHQDSDKAIQEFISLHYQPNDDQCLDITEKRDTLSIKAIRQLVLKKYHLELAVLPTAKPGTQRKVLKYLKELNGCSLRQLSSLTGLTLYKIVRVWYRELSPVLVTTWDYCRFHLDFCYPVTGIKYHNSVVFCPYRHAAHTDLQ
jgi:hypothetical protein